MFEWSLNFENGSVNFEPAEIRVWGIQIPRNKFGFSRNSDFHASPHTYTKLFTPKCLHPDVGMTFFFLFFFVLFFEGKDRSLPALPKPPRHRPPRSTTTLPTTDHTGTARMMVVPATRQRSCLLHRKLLHHELLRRWPMENGSLISLGLTLGFWSADRKVSSLATQGRSGLRSIHQRWPMDVGLWILLGSSRVLRVFSVSDSLFLNLSRCLPLSGFSLNLRLSPSFILFGRERERRGIRKWKEGGKKINERRKKEDSLPLLALNATLNLLCSEGIAV
jgi:hypothetical protein